MRERTCKNCGHKHLWNVKEEKIGSCTMNVGKLCTCKNFKPITINKQMVELKTFKDIFDIEDEEDYVHMSMLKAEAVKHAKLRERLIEEGKNITQMSQIEIETVMALPWIKHFFNITEEDLKLKTHTPQKSVDKGGGQPNSKVVDSTGETLRGEDGGGR